MLYNLIRGRNKALRLRFLRKAPKNSTICAIIIDAMHWNSYLRTTVQSSLLHIHNQMNSRQDCMLHRSCMGLDGIHFLVKCKKNLPLNKIKIKENFWGVFSNLLLHVLPSPWNVSLHTQCPRMQSAWGLQYLQRSSKKQA